MNKSGQRKHHSDLPELRFKTLSRVVLKEKKERKGKEKKRKESCFAEADVCLNWPWQNVKYQPALCITQYLCYAVDYNA